jgi:glutathione S-transferase
MTARYTLYVGTRNWSSWSLRPYMALMAIGQPFETVTVRLRTPQTRQTILNFSPSGKVPALRIDGFATVWDSLAICETLAERHPEAGLLPDDPRRRALARAYAAEMHSGFAGVRQQLGMEYARILPMPELLPETQQQLDRIIDSWESALIEFGKDGGFLFGRFSIADCMYAPVVSRLRTYGVTLPQIVQAYADRMWALPAMQAWLKDCEQELEEGIGFYPSV